MCIEISTWNEILYVPNLDFPLYEILHNLTFLPFPHDRKDNQNPHQTQTMYIVPNTKLSAYYDFAFLGLVWKLSWMDAAFNYHTNYHAYI